MLELKLNRLEFEAQIAEADVKERDNFMHQFWMAKMNSLSKLNQRSVKPFVIISKVSFGIFSMSL